MPTHVSAAHAARMYGRSEKTVRRWIATGKLPAEKIDGAYLVDLDVVAQLVGDVSAPMSTPGTDKVSAQSPPTDVRTDDEDVRPTERPGPLAQAEAISGLVQATVATVLGPLVAELAASRQTNERQAERIADLERENGVLSERLEHAARSQAQQEGRTAPQTVEPTADTRFALSARLWPALLTVAGVVVLVALLAWPR